MQRQVGGDKLTLSLGSENTKQMDLESFLPISAQPSNLELISALSTHPFSQLISWIWS